MTTVGIDPGLTGGIALISDAGAAYVYDMPIVQISKTGFVKNAVDVNGLASILKGLDVCYSFDGVYIERVNAFPGQGVASMFSLGMSFWGAAGVVAGLRLPLSLVEPAAWKRHFKLNKDKELSRGLASRLYPGVDLSRKKDHGKAEALLIARYGLETQQ
jgi:crossover junction endodeoxyribonuclease RuvC